MILSTMCSMCSKIYSKIFRFFDLIIYPNAIHKQKQFIIILTTLSFGIFLYIAGYALNNIPVSLRRCHLKYPYSHYYHHITPARFVGPSFDVEHILTPNPLSFSHLQNPHHRPDCLVDPTNPKITSIPPPSAASSGDNSSGGQVKRKRSWSRAVFSQLQRKGLEIQFQIQKYITKPDRRKLAARLGLTDAQVSSKMFMIIRINECKSNHCVNKTVHF